MRLFVTDIKSLKIIRFRIINQSQKYPMRFAAFRFLVILTVLINIQTGFVCAQDSSRLRISLLTCTPGDELYSIFGHSAIRIIDSSNAGNDYYDLVYNYGTFNFDDEGFYLKFMRGKLLYFISLERFEDFRFLYQSTNRGITEQLLYLSEKEKEGIQFVLNENLKEENKYYKYDFFLDNCTTRLRDIIEKSKNPQPKFPAVMPGNTRFRQAIHQYLDSGKQYWSKLGIDILLGAKTDRVMTSREQQFLPDNLMMALEKSTPKMSLTTTNLYILEQDNKKDNLFTPTLCFSLLLTFYFLISLSAKPFLQTMLTGMDGLLFFLTGLLGVILLLMWFFTDHSMTKNNYNLLWAIPSHLVMSFFISNRKKTVKLYFLFTSLLMAVVLAAWLFLPQQMNNSLIPFVLLLMYRSAMRYYK